MPRKRTSTWITLGLTVTAVLLLAGLLFNGSVSAQTPEIEQSQALSTRVDVAPNLQGNNPPPPIAPVDHGEFEILQQEFATPQDLTKACLSCHVGAATQVQHTTHWTC